MVNAVRYANSTICVMSFAALGWLLGINLNSYRLHEVLVCWLFFSLMFLSLALVILAGALVCCAGKCVIAWANKATRMTPKVALRPLEIQLKINPAGGKLN